MQQQYYTPSKTTPTSSSSTLPPNKHPSPTASMIASFDTYSNREENTISQEEREKLQKEHELYEREQKERERRKKEIEQADILRRKRIQEISQRAANEEKRSPLQLTNQYSLNLPSNLSTPVKKSSPILNLQPHQILSSSLQPSLVSSSQRISPLPNTLPNTLPNLQSFIPNSSTSTSTLNNNSIPDDTNVGIIQNPKNPMSTPTAKPTVYRPIGVPNTMSTYNTGRTPQQQSQQYQHHHHPNMTSPNPNVNRNVNVNNTHYLSSPPPVSQIPKLPQSPLVNPYGVPNAQQSAKPQHSQQQHQQQHSELSQSQIQPSPHQSSQPKLQRLKSDSESSDSGDEKKSSVSGIHKTTPKTNSSITNSRIQRPNVQYNPPPLPKKTKQREKEQKQENEVERHNDKSSNEAGDPDGDGVYVTIEGEGFVSEQERDDEEDEEEEVNDDEDNQEKKVKREISKEAEEQFYKELEFQKEVARKNLAVLISAGAGITEAGAKMVKFNAVKTEGLRVNMNEAIEKGEFNPTIKYAVANPKFRKLLEDPSFNFLTSVTNVAMNTHFINEEKELQAGNVADGRPVTDVKIQINKSKDKKNKKKQKQKQNKSKSRNHYSSDDTSDSAETSDDDDNDNNNDNEGSQEESDDNADHKKSHHKKSSKHKKHHSHSRMFRSFPKFRSKDEYLAWREIIDKKYQDYEEQERFPPYERYERNPYQNPQFPIGLTYPHNGVSNNHPQHFPSGWDPHYYHSQIQKHQSQLSQQLLPSHSLPPQQPLPSHSLPPQSIQPPLQPSPQQQSPIPQPIPPPMSQTQSVLPSYPIPTQNQQFPFIPQQTQIQIPQTNSQTIVNQQQQQKQPPTPSTLQSQPTRQQSSSLQTKQQTQLNPQPQSITQIKQTPPQPQTLPQTLPKTQSTTQMKQKNQQPQQNNQSKPKPVQTQPVPTQPVPTQPPLHTQIQSPLLPAQLQQELKHTTGITSTLSNTSTTSTTSSTTSTISSTTQTQQIPTNQPVLVDKETKMNSFAFPSIEPPSEQNMNTHFSTKRMGVCKPSTFTPLKNREKVTNNNTESKIHQITPESKIPLTMVGQPNSTLSLDVTNTTKHKIGKRPPFVSSINPTQVTLPFDITEQFDAVLPVMDTLSTAMEIHQENQKKQNELESSSIKLF